MLNTFILNNIWFICMTKNTLESQASLLEEVCFLANNVKHSTIS